MGKGREVVNWLVECFVMVKGVNSVVRVLRAMVASTRGGVFGVGVIRNEPADQKEKEAQAGQPLVLVLEIGVLLGGKFALLELTYAGQKSVDARISAVNLVVAPPPSAAICWSVSRCKAVVTTRP